MGTILCVFELSLSGLLRAVERRRNGQTRNDGLLRIVVRRFVVSCSESERKGADLDYVMVKLFEELIMIMMIRVETR